MNIGIDIRPLMSPVRTGVGEYTYELLNAVFEIDKNNRYFLYYNSYTDVSKIIPGWQQENIKYVSTRWPNKLFNGISMCFGRPRLDKLIEHKIDAFYSPNLNFTSVSKNCRFLLTVHDISFEFFPSFFSARQRLWHRMVQPKKQCARADVIFVPSANTRRDIVDYYGMAENKIKIIYPGLSLKKESAGVKEKYRLPDRFILFLGTIEPRKNISGLIEAFEKSYSSLSNPYSLVIAGANGWNNKAIFERISRSPVRDKIQFVGYIAPEEKYALYSRAELFAYPSFYEGFGFPVLEAMSAGTPVITSNRSSLPEVGADAVYYINPNNPLSLAEAFVRLTNDEKLRQYFRQNGLKQAEKFSWQNAAREWLNTIQTL